MSLYWITALSLGFLSSLHCIGMCGPIALALPLNRSSALSMWGGLLLNNLSRIAGYAVMGLLAGILGKSMAIAGLQNYLSVAAGVIMMLFLFGTLRHFTSIGFIQRFTGKWKSAAAKLFGSSSPYTLSLAGLLNAFLPCGFVYMALAGAAATGHLISGALFMMLFGAGTAPALIFVAFAGHMLKPQTRSRARKLTPVFVAALACVLILRGLNLNIPYISPASDGQSVHNCCHK